MVTQQDRCMSGIIFLSLFMHSRPALFILYSLLIPYRLSSSPFPHFHSFSHTRSFFFVRYHFVTHTHPPAPRTTHFPFFFLPVHTSIYHPSIYCYLRQRMLQGDIPQEQIQALRSVNRGVPPNSIPPATLDEIYHVDTQLIAFSCERVESVNSFIDRYHHSREDFISLTFINTPCASSPNT